MPNRSLSRPAQHPLRRGGLLEHLLVHERVVLAGVVVRGVEVELGRRPGGGREVLAVRREAGRGHGGQLAVVEVGDRRRVADQGTQVGGDVHLLVADADDQRAAVAGDHDPVGEAGVQDGDAVGALDLRQRVAHLALERVRLRAPDQVGEHLGVGLGDQLDAEVGQPVPQRSGVVDDAVVHDGDVTLGVHERVGVDVVGGAVSGPAGVADADLAGEPFRKRLGQVPHPAGLLGDPEGRPRRAAEHREPGRVVAAVLEPGQPLQQQPRGLLPSDVSDDSAHVWSSFPGDPSEIF